MDTADREKIGIDFRGALAYNKGTFHEDHHGPLAQSVRASGS